MPGLVIEQGDVAQLGERLPCTEEARGSNPLISTNGRQSIGRFDKSQRMCYHRKHSTSGLR